MVEARRSTELCIERLTEPPMHPPAALHRPHYGTSTTTTGALPTVTAALLLVAAMLGLDMAAAAHQHRSDVPMKLQRFGHAAPP